MIIIYACFSGTHAAVIAAAMHLGLLQGDPLPGWSQVKRLPHFDVPEGQGGLRYMGRTTVGHAVYTAAVGHDGETARRAVKTFLAALGREQDEVLWLDVSRRVSFSWRAGAFCRRYPFLSQVGRWLLQRSLVRDFPILVAVAREGCGREASGIKVAGEDCYQGVKPRLQAKT